MVAGAGEKNLGFVFEAAKGGRMDYAGNVALVFAAPAVRRLRVETSAGERGFLGERREVSVLVALDVFADGVVSTLGGDTVVVAPPQPGMDDKRLMQEVTARVLAILTDPTNGQGEARRARVRERLAKAFPG